jgi:hypothetical protein
LAALGRGALPRGAAEAARGPGRIPHGACVRPDPLLAERDYRTLIQTYCQ